MPRRAYKAVQVDDDFLCNSTKDDKTRSRFREPRARTK